jgi:hypothetical protein
MACHWQADRGRQLECYGLRPKFDRAQARIGVDGDLGRDGIAGAGRNVSIGGSAQGNTIVTGDGTKIG